MQTARHILSALLVLGLLSSGLHLTGPEDANRDNRVDLEDAILSIRDFVQSAEEPFTFKFTTENAISVLRSVAGLKASIRPPKDTKAAPSSMSPYGQYLLPSVHDAFHLDFSFIVDEHLFSYESLSVKPPTPPPEAGRV
jgi:hypothetical protein